MLLNMPTKYTLDDLIDELQCGSRFDTNSNGSKPGNEEGR